MYVHVIIIVRTLYHLHENFQYCSSHGAGKMYNFCNLCVCVCVCVCYDRVVHREELKILQQRLSDCVKREEVNHLQRCRPQHMAYWKSFRKYRSEG